MATNVRAGRAKPGLRAQHVACVDAAARIGSAHVEGATVGSTRFSFTPATLIAGRYHFSIGTAGSTTLVLQTVVPALLLADGESTVVVEGGTHNPFAPPYEFLAECFLPVLRRAGASVDIHLDRFGFYPRGGGQITATISPRQLQPLYLHRRGNLLSRRARAMVVGLAATTAVRELKVIRAALAWSDAELDVVEHQAPAHVQGNAVLISTEYEHVTELVTSIGERGHPAESVARRAAQEMQAYLAHDAPVGPHLADQLLVPLAIGAGGSYVTGPLTLHTTTNIDVIRRFLDDVFIGVEELPGDQVKVTVVPG